MKKLVSVATAATLAVSMVPSLAFAAAEGSSTDDTSFYTLPSQYVTDLSHSGNANGKAYSYKYLSSGISRVVGGFSQSMYYLMGINGVNFDRGLRSGAPWNSASNGRLTATHVTTVDGLMGTDVNAVPDEYLWNSCVYMNQNPGTDLTKLPKGDLYANKMVFMNSGNVQKYDTVAVEVDGAEVSIPSVIYMEANFISNSDSDWTAEGGKSLTDWVAIEKKRPGGDANYDPYIATWDTNSGGINYGTELFYKLASVVDKATADSKDANGNATLMSRYVDANGDRKTEGLYSSATELAQTYEDFAKATQYYMIKQINEKKVDKKVVAVICGYDPGAGKGMKMKEVTAANGNKSMVPDLDANGNPQYTENAAGAYTGEAAYACRIFDPNTTGESANTSTAKYGSRLANSLMNFTTDINTVLGANEVAFPAASGEENYVRWYTADQIAKNADAVFVEDTPYGNNIANYLAQNSAGDRQMVYSVDNAAYTTMNGNVNALVTACNASGAKANLYYKFPSHLFGVWYAQGFENSWLAPMGAAWLYPENFTSIENVMAFAAKRLWHIKSAEVNGVLAATCSDISMPKGSVFGSPASDYESTIDTLMNAGNAYYLSSDSVRNSINAMNKLATEETGDIATYDLAALQARTKAVDEAEETVVTVKTGVKVDTASGVATITKKKLTKADVTAAVKAGATKFTLGAKCTKIAPKAFSSASGKKIKQVTIKSKKLKKANIKNCFKGSNVKTVKVPKSKVKAYKKIFVKEIVGKQVTVKKA